MKIMRLFLLFSGIILSLKTVAQQQITLIAGTYTGPGKGEGIYFFDFNTKTGEGKLKSITKNTINPSYLTLTADRKFLYSVNEEGDKSAASAFKYDAVTKQATLLNRVPMEGKDPCYIIADASNVITANYSSGSITVYGRMADGKLGDIKQVVKHYGSGPDRRQASAHAHMAIFSPDKKFIISNDLGTDHIYIYKYNAAANHPMTLSDSVKVEPGVGPRHLTFSPDGKMAYLLGEFNGMVYTYSYANGKLNFKQKISTLKGLDRKSEAVDASGKPTGSDAADIHISADGKFLYASLRGIENSISLFAVAKDSKLTFVNTTPTLGITPRNFAITPDGNWLLAAHQRSSQIVVFKRNAATGKLTDSGKRIDAPAAVCLLFTN